MERQDWQVRISFQFGVSHFGAKGPLFYTFHNSHINKATPKAELNIRWPFVRYSDIL